MLKILVFLESEVKEDDVRYAVTVTCSLDWLSASKYR